MTRRYAAFLRGVSPVNLTSADLARSFEAAGFTAVRTVLASGNVVFTARAASIATLERRAERALEATVGRTFLTFVRPLDALEALLASDPYAGVRLPAGAKRVVTFLRAPLTAPPALPPARDGAQIVGVRGSEAFCAYVPGPRGPVFMTVLERTFGTAITTRTWESVGKTTAAAARGV